MRVVLLVQDLVGFEVNYPYMHSSGSLTLLLLEQHERGVLSESAKFYVRTYFTCARNGLTVFKTLLCC